MELINATRMVAGYTMGVDPSGREVLVIAVKGTFRLPEPGEPLLLADQQQPLLFSDVFWGEPGRSAPRYETDFAPRKLRCDVLLNGTAYAPHGRPVTRVQVGCRVGSWTKTFDVVGDRVWEAGADGIGASPTIPFERMPVDYGRAFGGTDDRSPDPALHAAYLRNPVGRGFHKHLKREWVDGSPLPNTEEPGRPITWVEGNYRPVAFGPIGRNWDPRFRLAGTYDDKWLEEHFPFLPPDFNELYYQAAPPDQQIPWPQGGEEIVLLNMTPAGRTHFVLPVFDAPIHVFNANGDQEDGALALDTILLEPDLGNVSLVWRATRPLRRNMYEVSQVMVGKRSRQWWSERETIGFPIPLALVTTEGDEEE